jgi:Brp/Blh family beta-carotene 15,15'-monooxygenase
MTQIDRVQGLVFSVTAIAIAGASIVMPPPGAQTELIIATAMILVLGVPHGALDLIFARQLHRVRTPLGWAAFGAAYAAFGLAVVGVWSVAPVTFLVCFLLISAVHFSGDPAVGTRIVSRVAYGGAVIFLPTLLHADAVSRLFTLLSGPQASDAVTSWLSLAAAPWLAGLMVCAAFEARRSWQTGLELLAVGLLAVFAPPLIAFAIFFCAMHSGRHILRTIVYARPMKLWSVLGTGIIPMALVLAGSILGWLLLDGRAFDAKLVQLIFVGLAALTVPHMALVERVRLKSWRSD